MIIAATSDLHGQLPWQPPPEQADIVIIAGDICPNFSGTGDKWMDSIQQSHWLKNRFEPWVESLGKPTYATWGNHDFVGQLVIDKLDIQGIQFLVDEAVEIDGVKLYFTPWVPNLARWAFSFEGEVPERYRAGIPTDTDVLVSHGPPLGVSDGLLEGGHVGSESLRDWLIEHPVPHIICGHIHEGRGVYETSFGMVYNVASLTRRYTPYLSPWTLIVV